MVVLAHSDFGTDSDHFIIANIQLPHGMGRLSLPFSLGTIARTLGKKPTRCSRRQALQLRAAPAWLWIRPILYERGARILNDVMKGACYDGNDN